MNEFSLLCRVLGTLFYRQPEDPVLAPLWPLIQGGQLSQHWPLEQDSLLEILQRESLAVGLLRDFNALFTGDPARVSPFAADWERGASSEQIAEFLSERGMPLPEIAASHFGFLLLAASWLEDQSSEDEVQAQWQLFDQFILPWCGAFLGKVEAHAETGFYRTLAAITRGAVQAMAEELNEAVSAAGTESGLMAAACQAESRRI